MLMIVTIPHNKFNAAVKDGSAGEKIGKILEAIKPESVHFTSICGKRTAVIVVDLPDASKIPALAEPFFLTFDADVQFLPCMTPDDLKRGGLDELGKKWS
ncbi:MAG TPA: panthothenate synthetase [Verrucomicrobiae bacterium]